MTTVPISSIPDNRSCIHSPADGVSTSKTCCMLSNMHRCRQPAHRKGPKIDVMIKPIAAPSFLIQPLPLLVSKQPDLLTITI